MFGMRRMKVGQYYIGKCRNLPLKTMNRQRRRVMTLNWGNRMASKRVDEGERGREKQTQETYMHSLRDKKKKKYYKFK